MINRKMPREKPTAPTVYEKIELWLKIATFTTTLVGLMFGGGWALYRYILAGANDWNIGVRLETKVLPYHDDLCLLVVNIKSKNPLNYRTDIDPALGDSYDLYVRKLAPVVKEETIMNEESGELIQKVNLLEGDVYELLPGVEFDDMRVIVLPRHSIVSLKAEVNIHNGDMNKEGKPDTDYVSASTVIRIEP